MIKTGFRGLLLAILLAACSPVDHFITSEHVILLQQAEMTPSSDYNHTPPDSAAWQKIVLPDNWDETRPDQGGAAWYRIKIDQPHAASEKRAVLLVNYSMNASLWWDGIQIASGGRMIEPVTRNWHNPLHGSISLAQLRPGRHWLHIYISGYANNASGLGGVYIGPENEIYELYNNVYFVQNTLSNTAFFAMLLLALAALLMWILRRSEPLFLWLFLASLLWALVIRDFIPVDSPLPRFYWENITHSAIDYYALVLLMIVNRLLRLRKAALEWFLALLFTAGWAIIMVFGEDANMMSWAMPLHSIAVMSGVYLYFLCAIHWRRNHNNVALVVGASITPQLLVSVHDWWLVYFGNQLESALMIQFAPPVTLLMLGGWMIYSFAKALQASETHTEQIEAEVTRVSNKLEEEQQQKTVLMKQHLISDERERFTRELHDGLGGYLSAMSSMLHDGVNDKELLADTVDKALLDMRLMMDGIGEECTDIGMILGMLKYRFSSQLRAWNIRVSWNMAELPMHCELSDGHGLHLMRIIQEAITNASRHAHADWVEVQASLMEQTDEPAVCIEVIDNGCGWNEMPEFGNGLSNMRKRADMMQATLSMVSMPDAGVRISLIIPVSISG